MTKPAMRSAGFGARFVALGADIAWAAQAAARSREAQRAMTRSRYGLGTALAVVAALIVGSALHGLL